jgi:exonuclease III
MLSVSPAGVWLLLRFVASANAGAAEGLVAAYDVYTFWRCSAKVSTDAGTRIDHLLLSKSLRKRLKDAGVDQAVRGKENPGDHAPAWIGLK